MRCFSYLVIDQNNKTMQDTQWRPIQGYEDYLISESGEIKSFKGRKTKRGGGLLSQKTDRYGYLCVSLTMNKVIKHSTVHRLVAITYISNPMNLATVDHIDDNRKNNHISNLQWMSARDNVRKARLGRKCGPSPVRGINNSKSKLTQQQADEICSRYLTYGSKHTTIRELSEIFGLTESVVFKIRHGWTHKDVPQHKIDTITHLFKHRVTMRSLEKDYDITSVTIQRIIKGTAY